MIQRINYKRDLERIELIVSKAKSAAWGPKLVPVSGRRKVNFFQAPIVFFLSKSLPIATQVRINLGDAHDEDGSVMGAKHVDMIVEDSHVYLVSFVPVFSFVSTNDRGSPIAKLEPTGERHLIDASTATRPSIGNTWFLALIKSLVQKFTSNKPTHTTHTISNTGAQSRKKGVPPDVDSDDASSATGSDGPGSDASTSRRGEGKEKTSAATRLGPTVKAGGMRRKVKRR